MADKNLSYRIRTVVGTDNPDYVGNLNVLLDQDYDTFEIMSLKIKSSDTYRLHNSNHGVITGRVIANNGFGIPNAKISLFIESDINGNEELRHLYPYTSTASKNDDKVRYNLLPDTKVGDCHQVVGTFPNKTYMLENDILLEIYDKYYKYTTRTNNSGDYMIIGVPTGEHKLHMDLDLSDCGILSQRPRDFVYKGYTIEQFENANKFKTGTDLDSLSQIFSQDLSVTVNPFWGNSDLGQTIGITRADINVSFKFEPTCVFIGSIVSDNASNGISKKCVPTNQMGAMDDLVTGEGRIEMIRKTPGGDTEEFQIKGTQLINGDGVWCYQIPMNLDYMRTDEYGNMVPTDDPEKGIATRTRVRFRVSMQDAELNTDNYFRAKVLVPNNPQNTVDGHEDYDYNFGSKTRNDSYRDLFWNNVYTVKSYIPRFSKSLRWKTERFTGIKHCNIAGNNNPIPYNNIRVKLPLMFTLICVLIKCYVFMVGIMNYVISRIGNALASIGSWNVVNTLITIVDATLFGIFHSWLNKLKKKTNKEWAMPFRGLLKRAREFKFVVLKEGLCPDLDTWYFSPMKPMRGNYKIEDGDGKVLYDLLDQTLNFIKKDYEDDDVESTSANTQPDSKSIDYQNGDWMNEEGTVSDETERICLTKNTDYLIACIEMALAQEYKVINFDFYNDWVNGLIYIPRWMREVKKKRKYWIFGKKKTKVKGCMNDSSIFGRTRSYIQLCSLPYKEASNGEYVTISRVEKGGGNESQRYHKNSGKKRYKIFGKRGGIVHEETTMASQNVYYLKPCEWNGSGKDCTKVNLFAVDIVLLGSLNNCDTYGVPQFFKYLSSSSYRMPTNLALTNMDTDGALYADDDNTKCIDTGIKEGVKEIQGDNLTLGNELKYYNGNNNERSNEGAGPNYETLDYGEDGNEGSDTIPVTEAAGVAWNYTGPGQGESSNKKKTLYFPGGHFLGISCVNSQTNKKSCVNLERVCEIGSSISQRHENVRKVTGNENGTGVEFKYAYNVPTGLIAEDEITDSDARAMFATLNQRRLIATRTNPDTGYKYYDFIYRRPKGFGGEMNSFVDAEKEYNTKVNIKDEDLEKFGINLGKENPDFDSDEPNNTQRRTIEDLNLDYYLFRMGLEYDQVKDLSFQKRKFLKEGYYLPQYENSYYFYFGLKDGATALDEFNKEFYAACDSSSIVKRNAELILSPSIDICNSNGELHVSIDNLEPEYTLTLSKKNDEGGWEEIKSVMIEVDEYTFEGLDFGTYKVEIVDSMDTYLSKVITIDAEVTASIKVNHFNAYKRYEEAWWNGGYITVDNLMVNGTGYDEIDFLATVNGKEKKYEGMPLEFYVDQASEDGYEVTVQYRCKNNGDYQPSVSLGTYQLFDTKKVHLYLGADNDIKIVGDGEEELNGFGGWYKPQWWSNLDNAVFGNEKKWALKHYLFAQDDIEEGTQGFDSNIRTDSSRALFGVAQNKSGFDNVVHAQGDTIDGYTLTDRNGYWQTLDNNGQNAKAYGTMAYKGSVAGGEYCGYIDNGNIVWDGPKKYSSGELKSVIGVLAKNKETGQIAYAKVDDGEIVFNDPDYINDSWVLFPLFRYPSIYRPFYATMFFFTHSDKVVTVESDEDSNLSPVVDFANDNSRLIGDIHNGITFEDKWGQLSICGLPASPLKGETALDINGIETESAKFANVPPLRPQRVGLKTEEMIGPWIIESDLDEYSFTLNEGTPSAKVDRAVTIEDTLSPVFWNNITYAADNGVAKLYGVGESESDVTYYVLPKSDIVGSTKIVIDGNALSKGSKTPLLYDDDGVLYVLGKYNENAPLDQLGGTVFIMISGSKAQFTKTVDGDKFIEKIEIGSADSIANDPSSLMSGYYDEFYDKGVTLQAVCPTLIKQNNEAWNNLYEKVSTGTTDLRTVRVDGKHIQLFDPDTDTIIGVYQKDTGYYGRSGVVMIYPYMEKSSQYKIEGNEPYIIVSPSSLVFPENGGTLRARVRSNVEWAIDVATVPSWISIDNSNMSGGAGDTTIDLVVSTTNNTDGTIRFYCPDNSDVEDTLKVSQKEKGGDEPKPPVGIDLIIDNKTENTFAFNSTTGSVIVAPMSSETIKLSSNANMIFQPSTGKYVEPWYVYGVDETGTNIFLGNAETASGSVTVPYDEAKTYKGFLITDEYLDNKTIKITNNTSGTLTISRTSGVDAGTQTVIAAGMSDISFKVYGNNIVVLKCDTEATGGWDIYDINGSYIGHGKGDQGITFNGSTLIGNDRYGEIEAIDSGEYKVIRNNCSDTLIASVGNHDLVVNPSTNGQLPISSGDTIVFKMKEWTKPWYLYGVDSSDEYTFISKADSASDWKTVSYDNAKPYVRFVTSNDNSNMKSVTITINNRSSSTMSIDYTAGENTGKNYSLSPGSRQMFLVFENEIISITGASSGGVWYLLDANGNEVGSGSGGNGMTLQGTKLITNKNYSNLDIKDRG